MNLVTWNSIKNINRLYSEAAISCSEWDGKTCRIHYPYNSKQLLKVKLKFFNLGRLHSCVKNNMQTKWEHKCHIFTQMFTVKPLGVWKAFVFYYSIINKTFSMIILEMSQTICCIIFHQPWVMFNVCSKTNKQTVMSHVWLQWSKGFLNTLDLT